MTKRTMQELALDYAAAGIAVFPCREKDIEGDDGYGKMRVYKEKTPIPSAGLKAATTVERVVRNRWNVDPASIIGAATGTPSGFWVLDIDIPSDQHKEDGRIWLQEMQELHGDLPATRVSVTANGGWHAFFNHVEGIKNSGGDIAPGVDVRGDGGFVIMPGSVMADGRFYEWEDDENEIADAPQWLIDIVLKAEFKEGFKAEMRPVQTTGTNTAYVTQVLDAEVAHLAGMTKGGRGAAANESAFTLGTLVGGGSLGRMEAEGALFNACVSNGLVATDGEREVMNKIRRGMDKGITRPRSAPEPARKSNSSNRDFTRMLENARRRAEEREEEENHGREDGDHYNDDDDGAEDGDHNHGRETIDDGDDTEEKGLRATGYVCMTDSRDIPPREWLWDQHLIRKFVSVTVAPGGVGKTALAIAEALSMTSGIDFLGVPVRRPLNVWIFNVEDPFEELQRRVEAVKSYYELEDYDINGRLFLDSGRDQELVIATEEKGSKAVFNVPIVESIIEEIIKNKIDVMIVDPFVSTHMVNENDNGAIDAIAKKWAQIADATNCAIDIVHHMKKVSEREATVEDTRGAGSLIGAARSVRMLSHMSQADADAAGIDEKEKPFLFSITNGKSNLSPLLSGGTWWRRHSQSLFNETSERPADNVPVIVKYEVPKFMEAAVTLTFDQREVLKGSFMGGGLPMLPPKKNEICAMSALEYALGMAPGDDPQKVKATMHSLLKNGVLVERVHSDAVLKKNVKQVFFAD